MAKIPRSDRIYSKLGYQIVNRSIPPGTRLYESALCKKWDVSRTPIREALRRLESEGLVTSHHHKGFVVNTITIEDIDQVYPIKISLEGLAGRFATPLISGDPKKLRALERYCRSMEVLFGKGDIGE